MFRMPNIKIAIAAGILLICAVSLTAAGRFDQISELGIRELYVDSLMIDVEIQGESRLTVDGRGENIPDNLRVKYERNGDILRVRVERRFALFALGRINGKLYFTVPHGIDLEIRSTSGSIEIQEMKSNRLKVGSSSGSIGLSEIESKIDAGSSSGSISIEKANGEVQAASSSGMIEIDSLKGALIASSSSGSVFLSDIEGAIDVNSSSGKIDMNFTNGKIRAETSSGDIDGHNIRITGDGSFHTSSGSIDMDFDNSLSDFTFKLSSTSGGIDVADIKGKKSLSTGSGRFLIIGVSSSGSQHYR